MHNWRHIGPDLIIPTTFAPTTTHPAARPVEWALGLRHALVDEHALTSLHALVVGPVASWETLESAELAIRAFVLHDRVDCLLPAVLVTSRVEVTRSIHGVLFQPPMNEQIESLLPVFEQVDLHNRPVFNEWLSIRGDKILNASSFWRGREPELSSPNPRVRRELFSSYAVDPSFQAAFSVTPSVIRAPSYFALPSSRGLQSQTIAPSSILPGSRFFQQFDSEWQQYLNRYQHVGFEIRLGPLLSIVLANADRRDEIPAAVLDLRDKFRRARAKFWEIFEDLRREPDPRKLGKMEAAAQGIIPSAFSKSAKPLRILFDLAFSFPSIPGAIQAMLGHYLDAKEPRNAVSAIDAAHLLAKELRRTKGDLVGPLRKHLTTSELALLDLTV